MPVSLERLTASPVTSPATVWCVSLAVQRVQKRYDRCVQLHSFTATSTSGIADLIAEQGHHGLVMISLSWKRRGYTYSPAMHAQVYAARQLSIDTYMYTRFLPPGMPDCISRFCQSRTCETSHCGQANTHACVGCLLNLWCAFRAHDRACKADSF